MTRTRFAYVTDRASLTIKLEDRRVLSIAYWLNEENNTVSYGTAINNPPGWVVSYEDAVNKHLVYVKGDRFDRAAGRELARARMEHPRTARTVSKVEGEHSIITVLRELAMQTGKKRRLASLLDVEARIAREELDWREYESGRLNEVAELVMGADLPVTGRNNDSPYY